MQNVKQWTAILLEQRTVSVLSKRTHKQTDDSMSNRVHINKVGLYAHKGGNRPKND